MSEEEGPSYTIVLKEARIVATVSDGGGAIVEQGLTLNLSEGRAWRIYSSDDTPDAMAYGFEFSVADGPAPDAAEQIEARIVIEGIGTDGKRLEIRGDGFVGYDDHGNVEGHFDEPPVIYSGEASQVRSKARAWSDDARPKLSDQYRAAARGRDLGKYQAEDA